MASYNKVLLLGNLTRDPDLRSLPSGQNVCELGVAVSRRYQSNDGRDVEETCFVDVVVWGRSAANCKQYLEKGSQVFVEGRLQLDQWEDRNGGGRRSKLRVVAEQIQFINRRSAGGDPGDGNGSYGGNYNDAPAPSYRGGNNSNYGGGRPSGGLPRQSPPAAGPGGMPRAPQTQMPQQQPPMPPMPDGAFNPDDGMEDDIPF